MDHELWRMVAAGVLDSTLSLIESVPDEGDQRLLWNYQAFRGFVFRDALIKLGYVPNPSAVENLLFYIADADYDPIISPRANRPINAASDGTTLSCDTPPDGYTAYVYRLDGKRFVQLGPLADHSTPGAGVYVLALMADTPMPDGAIGLPSAFLQIS